MRRTMRFGSYPRSSLEGPKDVSAEPNVVKEARGLGSQNRVRCQGVLVTQWEEYPTRIGFRRHSICEGESLRAFLEDPCVAVLLDVRTLGVDLRGLR